MKFLKLFSLKKYFIFIGIFILFLMSPYIAFAGAFEALFQIGATVSTLLGGGDAADIANGIIGAIITAASSVSLAIMQITLDFLNWTASGDFVQSGMMSSIDNPMIATGWGAMRNLANILLIFGLVAIAISIMVGYEETKAKKMLIQFVITALLINFTPVLCGVFIDIANIIMASFLKGGVSPAMISAIQNAKNVNDVESLPSMILLLIFSIFASIFYILYGLLFMIRYIYLWWLIVLSPIALASRVFPSNEIIGEILPAQCQWNTWKKDFLNWVFIGVPAAFSIYLSETMMAAIVANPDVVTSSPSGYLGGAFSLIFSYFVAMAVMVMGFFMTVSKGGDVGAKLKGTASSIGRGAWSRTGGKVTDFAKDQTVGRMDRFGRGLAEGYTEGSATVRANAAAKGEKASRASQFAGGWRRAMEKSTESETGNENQRKNADKAIAEKAREGFVAEIKDRSSKEKDAILAQKDNSIRGKAQRDFIIKERADKGELKDSEAALVLANQDDYDKKTKEAVMKRMPHLVPQLNASKRTYTDDKGNTITRTDEEMILDFMKNEMTIGDRKKIQLSSAMNHGTVLRGLDESQNKKEFSAIISKTTNRELKEFASEQDKLQDAYSFVAGSASRTGIIDRTEANKIIDEAEKKKKEIVDRINYLKGVQSAITSTAEQIAEAKKEKDRLDEVLKTRNRFLKGINL
ncbi:MAG: hypothetical protein PHR47_03470 [Candidatus Pacebacteria bacterium]|nr:hypothetical protein [Candidatus Paceibacterota bacterium]